MSTDQMLEAIRQMEAALSRFKAELKRQQAIEQAAQPITYPAPAEQWFHPKGESCIQYGAADGADQEPELDA